MREHKGTLSSWEGERMQQVGLLQKWARLGTWWLEAGRIKVSEKVEKKAHALLLFAAAGT